MRRLRLLYGRARPDRAELNILRGILAATRRAAGKD
jgi:tRNA C32,U32 (ribose-2'-O)-methylase TrmJ